MSTATGQDVGYRDLPVAELTTVLVGGRRLLSRPSAAAQSTPAGTAITSTATHSRAAVAEASASTTTPGTTSAWRAVDVGRDCGADRAWGTAGIDRGARSTRGERVSC